MADTTSIWYNTPKDPQATVFGGMVPLAMIDEKNYQKFFEPGHPRIWDDQSNPMDIMGRLGFFLSLLKEGMSNSPIISNLSHLSRLLSKTLTTSLPIYLLPCLHLHAEDFCQYSIE